MNVQKGGVLNKLSDTIKHKYLEPKFKKFPHQEEVKKREKSRNFIRDKQTERANSTFF